MEPKEFEKYIEIDEFDTKELLRGIDLTNVQADVDLEEILAEYGSKKTSYSNVPEDVTEEWINEGYELEPVYAKEEPKAAKIQAAEPNGLPCDEPESSPAAWDPEPQNLYQPEKPFAEEEEEAQEPRGKSKEVPLEMVMAQIVDAVMEEEEAKRQVAQPVVRRGLFSKKMRKFEDTESFVQEEAAEESTPEEEVEDPTPERNSKEATADYHRQYKRCRKCSRPALFLALLAGVFTFVEYSGIAEQYLTFEITVAVGLAMLALQLVACYPLFICAGKKLVRLKCSPELMTILFALACAADSATVFFLEERGSQLPFAAVAVVALYFILRGEMLRLRGLRDSCHMTTYAKEPYVVTAVAGGFRKQSCDTDGFIRMTDCESQHREWYNLLLPVILTATVVFAVLVAFNRFDTNQFLWYWSAILGGAVSFAFTAAFGTPLGKLARRLQRDGCAISGYSGAEMMSRKGSMVLTDNDLFPPGTVFMNGMKAYANDAIMAISYASSLLDVSGSGLRQVFADLRKNQGGHAYPVEDFSFYQEGGISGLICGETVILGRADFMAQMGVRLPKDLKFKTGVFLAVDKELTAVFAVKYMPSDNVDAALQSVLNNGICPVFAVRDFNITPSLIKRKFKINTKKRCLYPELSERLALSEEERESNGNAGALLFREGLMPYAETVVGGKRMHGAVKKNCAWVLIGSICGTLLAFYLTFVSGFAVLTPVALLLFQLLWSVPIIMINGWVTQY